MSYVLISLFIGFVFLVVWADRREELWDTLRSKYSTARTSSIRSPSEPIHILRPKRKQKSWLNAMHVQIKDSGLYIAPVFFLHRIGAICVPWSELAFIESRKFGLIRKHVLLVKSLHIELAISMKHQDALESVGLILTTEKAKEPT